MDNNKNEAIYMDNVDYRICNKYAEENFLKIAGLNKEGVRYDRMRNDAINIRARIASQIELRGAYICTDNFELSGKTLNFNNIQLSCNAFSQINPLTVRKVYIYVLTAGDFAYDDGNLTNNIYADMWGTSYLEAFRNYMGNLFMKGGDISDSFGPGFYGMNLKEIETFISLFDMDRLNMKLLDSYTIIPEKSCAGLYFNVSDEYLKIDSACEHCAGNVISCKFCSFYNDAKA